MASPENDLNELAIIISTAIEKARQSDLHPSAYILSMVVVEASEATKAAADEVADNRATVSSAHPYPSGCVGERNLNFGRP
jgi:hypothetical protein